MRSAALDDHVTEFLGEQSRKTAEEFGKQLADRPLPLLEWGSQPEFRAVTADGRPRIFLVQEGADWWRIRYQIAHELFHWLCSPPQMFHWTHELFAVEMAVRAMEEIGEHGYAKAEMDRLSEDANLLSVDGMLTTPLDGVYPPGLYGRAWVTGRHLIDAVGWERLKLLAGSFDENGKPDAIVWLRSLAPQDRTKVESVLGTPSPAWV